MMNKDITTEKTHTKVWCKLVLF